MNVGIVTHYSGLNYGAFLQAYAMQRTLIQLGHRPEFINLDLVLRNRFYECGARKPWSRAELELRWFNLRKLHRFRTSWRTLHINQTPYAETRKHYDAIVLGSDEIWNLMNGSVAFSPECFGKGLEADRLIAYAPSIGKGHAPEIAAHDYVVEGLNRIAHLSGRDEATCDLIRAVTGREPAKVLDPTFLVDLSGREAPCRFRDYILVYTYNFSGEQVAVARALGSRLGLPLLSVGFHNDWCDRCVPASPFGFLGLLKQARHVITDTFHGTCFSLIYRKSLAVFGGRSPKVSALLQDLDLAAADVRDVETAEAMLRSELVTAGVRDRLAERKDFSLRFLAGALRSP